MKNFFGKIGRWITGHKFVTFLIAVVVLGGGYWEYGNLTAPVAQTKYVLATVQKGTLVTSVSGSGQVSVVSQLDLKPKVSGNVIGIPVREGQAVKAGDIIVQLDSTDAEKAVRDATANLESAKISLEKLKQPADELSITQAGNALESAKQAKTDAQSGLVKAYDDGFNAVANAFLDLPSVMTGLDNMLNAPNLSSGRSYISSYYDLIQAFAPNAYPFLNAARDSYTTARTAYDKNFDDYKNASRYSSQDVVDALISETYNTTKTVTEAIKNLKNFLDLVNDTVTLNVQQGLQRPATLTTHQTNVQNYTGTTNDDLGTLLNIKNSIQDDRNSIANADRSIDEKTQSLQKLKDGADPLDIQSQELSIQQRQNALLDAKQNLADYFIRAPFDGIVAKISVKKGDPASGAVATVISPQQIANVTLNEVDVAKVKLGQRATMTFDAIDALTITGKVTKVDTIGTVSQSVVTYNVEITFDVQDVRVKPAMSVTAAIITDTKQDVLLVPNSAVKTQGTTHYVDMLAVPAGTPSTSQGVTSAALPARQTVEIGAVNDSMTEIVSGLQEGDSIVARTISATATAAASSASSGGIRLPGLGGGGVPGR
jgi:HlyD family secretion protein